MIGEFKVGRFWGDTILLGEALLIGTLHFCFEALGWMWRRRHRCCSTEPGSD